MAGCSGLLFAWLAVFRVFQAIFFDKKWLMRFSIKRKQLTFFTMHIDVFTPRLVA